MLNSTVSASIARQLMISTTVELDGKRLPIHRLGHQHLKSVSFTVNGHESIAIDQGAEKPGRSGQLARIGDAVVQSQDVERNGLVAVSAQQQRH